MGKFALFAIYFLIYCNSKPQSNFDVGSYEGIFLDGKQTKLSDLKFERIAVNVYSPTCIPCIKEIPAINFIAKELSKKKNSVIILAVDPYQIVENSEGLSFGEAYSKAKEIMEKEISNRNIHIPVIVMKKPFRVNPEGGLITGTPETLIFKNSPFSLYYNFVGPISERTGLSDLEKDAKIQFFLKMVGG